MSDERNKFRKYEREAHIARSLAEERARESAKAKPREYHCRVQGCANAPTRFIHDWFGIDAYCTEHYPGLG